MHLKHQMQTYWGGKGPYSDPYTTRSLAPPGGQGAQQLSKIPTRHKGPIGEATPIGLLSQKLCRMYCFIFLLFKITRRFDPLVRLVSVLPRRGH